MPSNLTLTTEQNCPARVNILDAAGNVIENFDPSWDTAYESNDQAVASIVTVAGADKRDSLIVTNGVGSCLLTASLFLPDGTAFHDQISLTVEAVVPPPPVPASIAYVAGTPVPKNP